jgi:hypothetical protein
LRAQRPWGSFCTTLGWPVDWVAYQRRLASNLVLFRGNYSVIGGVMMAWLAIRRPGSVIGAALLICGLWLAGLTWIPVSGKVAGVPLNRYRRQVALTVATVLIVLAFGLVWPVLWNASLGGLVVLAHASLRPYSVSGAAGITSDASDTGGFTYATSTSAAPLMVPSLATGGSTGSPKPSAGGSTTGMRDDGGKGGAGDRDVDLEGSAAPAEAARSTSPSLLQSGQFMDVAWNEAGGAPGAHRRSGAGGSTAGGKPLPRPAHVKDN